MRRFLALLTVLVIALMPLSALAVLGKRVEFTDGQTEADLTGLRSLTEKEAKELAGLLNQCPAITQVDLTGVKVFFRSMQYLT